MRMRRLSDFARSGLRSGARRRPIRIGNFEMDATLKNRFLAELDDIIEAFSNATSRSGPDANDFFGISGVDASEIVSRSLSAAERIGGKSFTYFDQINSIVKSRSGAHLYIYDVIGIIKALRYDLDKGYITSLEESVHGDVFTDYIEMAEHLSKTNYKDAAAVIGGSTLEAHIRQMCIKFSVPISDNGKPKNTDTLNADLMKAGAYNKSTQKIITGWLGIRNNAAHGQYTEYDKGQVANMIDGIRNFILRYPA